MASPQEVNMSLRGVVTRGTKLMPGSRSVPPHRPTVACKAGIDRRASAEAPSGVAGAASPRVPACRWATSAPAEP